MSKKMAVMVNQPIRDRESYLINDLLLFKQHLGYTIYCYSLNSFPKKEQDFHQFPVSTVGLLGTSILYYLCIPFLSLYTLIKNPKLISKITSLKKLWLVGRHHKLLSKLKQYHVIYLTYGHLLLGREDLFSLINKPVLISFRGKDIAYSPYEVKNAYSFIQKKKYYLHFISKSLQKAWEDNYPPHPNTYCIPQHLEDSLLQQTITPEERRNTPIKIVNIGRLDWSKNQGTFLKALHELQKKNIPFEAEIYGNGEEKNKLLYLIDQLSLHKKVSLKGNVSHKQLIHVLKQTDFVVNTSILEGYNQSIAEAQALGCLAISTNSQGIDENIQDGKTGFIVELIEHQKIARIIEHFCHQPKKRYDIQQEANLFSKSKNKLSVLPLWEKIFLVIESGN